MAMLNEQLAPSGIKLEDLEKVRAAFCEEGCTVSSLGI